jgi:hypothetical protein
MILLLLIFELMLKLLNVIPHVLYSDGNVLKVFSELIELLSELVVLFLKGLESLVLCL